MNMIKVQPLPENRIIIAIRPEDGPDWGIKISVDEARGLARLIEAACRDCDERRGGK